MGRRGLEPAGQQIGSVARAIAVLDALASSPDGLRVNELARQIDANPSTASRLLATLEHGGLVRRDPRGGFKLGLRILSLSEQVLTNLDVRDVSRPHLHALVDRTGETATLSVPVAGEAVTVDFVPSKNSVVSMARVGRPNALHATSIGKTMLAFSPDAELPAARTLERFTERSIRTPAELERVLEQTREAGWAESVAEREDDLAALAAPVRGPGGQLVAIVGLQGPVARMGNARRLEFLPPLLEAAAAISREVGGESRAAPD